MQESDHYRKKILSMLLVIGHLDSVLT